MTDGWFDRFQTALTAYLRPRLILVLVLGFASGLPYLLTSATLGIRMRQECVDLGPIGLFALVGLPYTLKFLWAPLMDRLPCPGFTNLFGRRRGWMMAIHIALIFAIGALGVVDPNPNHIATQNPQCGAGVEQDISALLTLTWIALLVAFLSATQDIAIDAYRVEVLKDEEFGAGAAMAVYGFRGGMLMAQVGTLFLVESFDWEMAYILTGMTLLIGVIAILFAPRADPPVDENFQIEGRFSLAALFGETYWAPLKEFIQRRGWVAVLLFVLLFKFGDALLSQMSGALYVDLGFTTSEIATIGKLYGFAALMIGTFLGGVLVIFAGLGRALLVAGILQAISNVGFWRLAEMGHDLQFFAAVIGFESFASGLGQTAFVAFLMSLCNRRFTAGQFAFLTSIMAFSPKVMVAPAGFLAEALGWPQFCLITSIAALPGLALLLWMRREYPEIWRLARPKEA